VNFSRGGGRKISGVVIALAAPLILFAFSPFGTIAAGERGVHLRFTADNRISLIRHILATGYSAILA
jgi:hypothetical protein